MSIPAKTTNTMLYFRVYFKRWCYWCIIVTILSFLSYNLISYIYNITSTKCNNSVNLNWRSLIDTTFTVDRFFFRWQIFPSHYAAKIIFPKGADSHNKQSVSSPFLVNALRDSWPRISPIQTKISATLALSKSKHTSALMQPVLWRALSSGTAPEVHTQQCAGLLHRLTESEITTTESAWVFKRGPLILSNYLGPKDKP